MSDALQCGLWLHLLLASPGTSSPLVVDDVLADVRRILGSEEHAPLVLAQVAVESRFSWDAVSEAGAVGLLQVTAPAGEDARKECGVLAEHPSPRRALLREGICYLRHLRQHYSSDEELVLAAYNGGYVQAERLRAGRSIAAETANYVLLVRRLRDACLTRGGKPR